jgi:polyhydroxyalkanoate synthesis regulator phasin
LNLNRKHKVFVAAAALMVAGGSGAAIAASQTGSRAEESQGIIDDAAEELGIPSSKLTDALQKALSDRVDEAVAAGRLSKAEGDELKERIQSDDFPLIGGLRHGPGHAGFFGHLDEAASYLGLTESELRSELQEGKSLAQVARDHGKSVDGLVDALVASPKERLDQAVASGRITQAEANSTLADLKERITERVESTDLGPRRFRSFGGFGFRHFGGPPA